MDKKIFCRKKLRLHRNRIIRTIENYDFLMKFSAENLFEMVRDLPSFNPINILEVGARHGLLTSLIKQAYPHASLIITDISEKMLYENPNDKKIILDEEQLCFKDNSFDLIISSLNLHWINDLPEFLLQIKNILRDKGVFIADLIGGESFKTLRYNFIKAESLSGLPHSPHISPLIEQYSLTSLLQSLSFKHTVTDKNLVTVKYKDILSLMRDLQNMGESAAFIDSHNYALSKKVLNNLEGMYTTEFEENFEIISLIVMK